MSAVPTSQEQAHGEAQAAFAAEDETLASAKPVDLQAEYAKWEREMPLDGLFSRIEAYMTVVDPDAVAVVLATAVAAAAVDDDPLWLMLVGPSSGSKSETIRTVAKLADSNLSDLTRAGLLGGHMAKRDDAVVTVRTGLLAKLGDGCNALVTISDLSPLLSRGSVSGQEQSGIYEALRDIYDGKYTRTMDRLEVSWNGRLTLLAGVTPAIDAMRTYTTALGTRFCYFRLDPMADVDRLKIARMVANRSDLKSLREAARSEADAVVQAARERVANAVISDVVRDTIVSCANLAAYGRVNLPRDYRGDVSGMADWEEPGRLTGQLCVLARSLTALGIGDDAVQRIVKRTARSCMPADMLAVLRACGDWRSTSEVARRAGVNRSHVATRALEAWAATGVIEERAADTSIDWRWSETHEAGIESVM